MFVEERPIINKAYDSVLILTTHTPQCIARLLFTFICCRNIAKQEEMDGNTYLVLGRDVEEMLLFCWVALLAMWVENTRGERQRRNFERLNLRNQTPTFKISPPKAQSFGRDRQTNRRRTTDWGDNNVITDMGHNNVITVITWLVPLDDRQTRGQTWAIIM